MTQFAHFSFKFKKYILSNKDNNHCHETQALYI